MKAAASWMLERWQSILLVTGLLLVVGVVSAVNMSGYPNRYEDEGTYVAQAWAIEHWRQLTHYTYWYDHPPIGWILLSGWTIITSAFERYDSAIMAGREFMVVAKIASAGLLYVLARRLGMRKTFAALAVLLFALSPLSVEFGRLVMLDNTALPWLLAAFVLALSPRQHIVAAIGSAVCMAVAVLSKETMLILLPALLYALWQNSDERNRRFVLILFSGALTLLGTFYILYAALKNELFEGEGHVSLIGALRWQLFGRQGSGSLFEPGTNAHGILSLWTGIDVWLLGLGAVLVLFAFFYRQLRPIAFGLLILIVMMLRPGYLPLPYVIAMLPLAALIIAGVADYFLRVPTPEDWEKWRFQARGALIVIAVAVLVQTMVPTWHGKLAQQTTMDADRPYREVIAWIDKNVGRNERLVVDSVLWVDLVEKGFNNPRAVWIYKTETDPAVVREIGGWRGMDYVTVSKITLEPQNREEFPTIFDAKDHSQQVASFGEGSQQIIVLKVSDDIQPVTTGSR